MVGDLAGSVVDGVCLSQWPLTASRRRGGGVSALLPLKQE